MTLLLTALVTLTPLRADEPPDVNVALGRLELMMAARVSLASQFTRQMTAARYQMACGFDLAPSEATAVHQTARSVGEKLKQLIERLTDDEHRGAIVDAVRRLDGLRDQPAPVKSPVRPRAELIDEATIILGALETSAGDPLVCDDLVNKVEALVGEVDENFYSLRAALTLEQVMIRVAPVFSRHSLRRLRERLDTLKSIP